jgi:hypothetical protein
LKEIKQEHVIRAKRDLDAIGTPHPTDKNDVMALQEAKDTFAFIDDWIYLPDITILMYTD